MRTGPNSGTALPSGVRLQREGAMWHVQVADKHGGWTSIPYVGSGNRRGVYGSRHLKNATHRARLATLLYNIEDGKIPYTEAFQLVMKYALTYHEVTSGAYKRYMRRPQPPAEFELAVRTKKFTRAPLEQQTTDEPPIGEAPVIPEEPPMNTVDNRPTETSYSEMQAIKRTLDWLDTIVTSGQSGSDEREAAHDARAAIRWLLQPKQKVIVVTREPYVRPSDAQLTISE